MRRQPNRRFAAGFTVRTVACLTRTYIHPDDGRDMNTYLQYAVGCGLQVVGLLNVVFLVGVPIWWAGRRLCRNARADDRPPLALEH
ncbi:hypothetical protein BRD01_13760 [Halobacteriales archaeon QS_8_65_32]|nr:MAG: hypothetical protein BRD01_13760 [Halobacteriales archaeon QS_8_65_32]